MSCGNAGIWRPFYRAYCALHKIGVHPEETHSPRGEFERGDGSPLSVGPAGRAPRLRRLCKRGSLPRERSVAGARSTLLPQRGVGQEDGPMLRKIISIKAAGRFLDYGAAGDVEL